MASLEKKANEIASDSRSRAEQLMSDLRNRRDAFQDQVKKQAAAAWLR